MCRFKRGDCVGGGGGPGRKELPITEEHIIGALRETGGIVYKAALFLGISNVTLYKRMKLNPEKFKEIREEIDHSMYDMANDGVRANLMVGNAKVCMFIKSRYEAKETMARFPEGDQTEYMNGGNNTFIQQNINIQDIKYHTEVNKLTDRAEKLGVSPERVERIRRLQEDLTLIEA
jgi:hypothetical protein